MNLKRGKRRWKTKCIHKRRAKNFARIRYFNTIYKDGEWIEACNADVEKYIQTEQQGLLENPKLCGCGMCSTKKQWDRKSKRAKMRRAWHYAIHKLYPYT